MQTRVGYYCTPGLAGEAVDGCTLLSYADIYDE